MLATIVAQTGFIAIWSYPLLAPLALWIVIILSRRSVWVVLDRAYQNVTIESRRILGFVTFKRAIRELQELQAVPVTTRYRSESLGGETTWTFHLMFGDDRVVAIGSVVNDARKVESGPGPDPERRGRARYGGALRPRKGAAALAQHRAGNTRQRPDCADGPDIVPSDDCTFALRGAHDGAVLRGSAGVRHHGRLAVQAKRGLGGVQDAST